MYSIVGDDIAAGPVQSPRLLPTGAATKRVVVDGGEAGRPSAATPAPSSGDNAPPRDHQSPQTTRADSLGWPAMSSDRHSDCVCARSGYRRQYITTFAERTARRSVPFHVRINSLRPYVFTQHGAVMDSIIIVLGTVALNGGVDMRSL